MSTVTNIENYRKPTEKQVIQADFKNAPAIKGNFNHGGFTPKAIPTIESLKSDILFANQFLIATKKQHDLFRDHKNTSSIANVLDETRTNLSGAIEASKSKIILNGELSELEIKERQEKIKATFVDYERNFRIAEASANPPIQQEMKI